MIIKDVVNLAKYSELSGVAVKDNIEAIVAFINLGMLELYKKFPVRISEHVITLDSAVSYYTMPEDFLYSIEAYGEAPANSLNQTVYIAINDEDVLNSIFFTDWNTVQVPAPVTDSHISIVYATKPDAITVAQAEDGVSILDLPDSLVDALLSYIGYRAYLGVRSDAQSENNAHWVRFTRNCNRARDLGVAFPPDAMSMSGRVFGRGFV